MSISAVPMKYDELQALIDALKVEVVAHGYDAGAVEIVLDMLRFDESEIVVERYMPPPVGPDERGYYRHPPTSKKTYLRLPWEAG